MDFRWIIMIVLSANCAQAELNSLFVQTNSNVQVAQAPASLFSGAQSGMFAPLPERVSFTAAPPAIGDTLVDRLLALIALAEAGPAGYDAVQYGARVRPSRKPTQMTLREIYEWIDATPGQPHAIGRYQFIPDTLRRVATIRGFGPDVRFTEDVQDALALVLLNDAGLDGFRAGEVNRHVFMRNLAQIWAGLPLPNGQSYYDGYAGNSATMTWAAFDAGMTRIWDG